MKGIVGQGATGTQAVLATIEATVEVGKKAGIKVVTEHCADYAILDLHDMKE